MQILAQEDTMLFEVFRRAPRTFDKTRSLNGILGADLLAVVGVGIVTPTTMVCRFQP